jgi:hypothetical protein
MTEQNRRVELIVPEREQERAEIYEANIKRKRAEKAFLKAKKEETIARLKAQIKSFERIKKTIEAEEGGYDLLNEDLGLSIYENKIKNSKKQLRKLKKRH